MTQSNNQLEGEALLQHVAQHVYLVSVTVGWEKMSYQIADAVVEAAGESDIPVTIPEEFRNHPQWNLMPAEWHNKFIKLEGRVRRTLSQASKQFTIKGMALVPIVRAPEIFAQLRELRSEMEGYVNNFCNVYDDILENLKYKLDKISDGLYDKAAKKLPKSSAVRRKFNMHWFILPLGGNSSALPVTYAQLARVYDTLESLSPRGDDEQLATRQTNALRVVSTVLDHMRNPIHRLDDETAIELIEEARGRMHTHLEELVEGMCVEPREEAAAAADHILQSLQSGRKLMTSSLTNLRNAYEKIRGFAFLQGPELLQRMRQCENAMAGVTVTELNTSHDVGARVASALQAVSQEARCAGSQASAQRAFRNIKIRPEPGNVSYNKVLGESYDPGPNTIVEHKP